LKQIYLPGDVISEKPEQIDNTYVEEGKTYSMVTGIYDPAKRRLIQLEGEWIPQKGDLVIGIVSNSGRNGMYTLDLSHFMSGLLIEKRGSSNFAKGDIVEAEVENVENRKTVVLTMPKVLKGGTVMEIKPSKVHRVIGKNNTMIKQIADAAKTTIVPGENGIIWIDGGDVALAESAIHQVEREAHVSGLTEIIKQMLVSKVK
jgi:exosome complex RNA-binding protein Rrp4